MASCARICCGGIEGGGYYSLRCGEPDGRTISARPPNVVSISSHRDLRCSAVGKISMSMAEMAPPPHLKRERRRIGGREKVGSGSDRAVVSREKLDEWMRASVVDIVKNLREAPLLVHVYAGSNGTVRTTTPEKAEGWRMVKGRWERGEAQLPEGVIFVEELEDNNGEDSDRRGDENNGGGSGCATRAWGIVAQGRGLDCGPVCYLLKTSRVGPGIGSGSGIWCTHFCLIRVKSFRETAESQLRNCWLLQAGQ